MLYRISVTERGLTGIANIFRSRLSRLDDLLGAGTVPLSKTGVHYAPQTQHYINIKCTSRTDSSASEIKVEKRKISVIVISCRKISDIE